MSHVNDVDTLAATQTQKLQDLNKVLNDNAAWGKLASRSTATVIAIVGCSLVEVLVNIAGQLAVRNDLEEQRLKDSKTGLQETDLRGQRRGLSKEPSK